MKKSILVKRAAASLSALLLVSSIVACAKTKANAEKDGVKVIPVGVMSTAKPDAYIDENGKLTGYDVEVLRAIDELLPQYTLNFQTMEFTEILNGLATGRVLAGSQEFEWNEERAANYLFGEVPLIGYNTYILTLDLPEYANIKGIEDMGGKSTFDMGSGGSLEAIIRKFNDENPGNEIKTSAVYSGFEDVVNAINKRVVDFWVCNEQIVAIISSTYDVSKWKLHLNAKVYDSNSYILFGKNETQLQKDFDGALRQLTDSGKLSELSIQFYGKDFTVKSGE